MKHKNLFKQPVLFVLCWTLLTFVLLWAISNFIFDDHWKFISIRALATFISLLIAGTILYYYRSKKDKK
ncbi:MAG: hypothetical protein LBR28_02975 [Bacteroidales bacterium]|nr:hypothetical protein [Bacteroidales bacterium]